MIYVAIRLAKNPEKLSGLAIVSTFLQPEKKVESFSYDKASNFRKALQQWAPCKNCQFVITHWLKRLSGTEYYDVEERWSPAWRPPKKKKEEKKPEEKKEEDTGK